MNSENEICTSNECATTAGPTQSVTRYKPHYTSNYSEDAWEVKVAMPGVKKEDVELSVENEIMEIVGLRRMDHPEGWKRLTGSSDDRRYELRLDVGPEVEDSKIEAKLASGELLIRLPLKEEAKPRSIPVG